LVRPPTEFCSWMAQRAPSRKPASTTMPVTYPPVPTTQSGPKERTILTASMSAFTFTTAALPDGGDLALDAQGVDTLEIDAELTGDPLLHAPVRADKEDLSVLVPVPDPLGDGHGRHDVAARPSCGYDDPHTLAPLDTERIIPEVMSTVRRLDPP
jgi:hypothetical protein